MRITGIVPIQIIGELETNFRACGVPGVTVYVDESDAPDVIGAIVRCARNCKVQAGIRAVESIDRLVGQPDGVDLISGDGYSGNGARTYDSAK